MNNKVLLLGCGNLGSLLIDSWEKKKIDLTVLEKNKNLIKALKKKYTKYLFETSLENIKVSEYSIIILCVKPINSIPLIKRLAKSISEKQIFISLVAGLESKRVKKIFARGINVFRVMPNILASVMSSSTAFYCNEKTSHNQRKKVEMLFSSLGSNIWLKDEKQFDFFTSMFGGGPAVIFYLIKTLISITKKSGFETKLASDLVMSLFNGTSKFLEKYDGNIDFHISRVASKGGTTEEILNYFSRKDRLLNFISRGITKGSEKSKLLKKQFSKI
ncbi:NAD(P)-binding domain-containing protein [Rickettsiales bacterium]|nr:NAD(P)-binding domain-containing protein [Rickettsiales bacterium]